MKLNPQAARTDLTDRECAKIIGGLLGTLVQLAEPETVRKAVHWWAENDRAWAPMIEFAQLTKQRECGQ